ncbi:hypothetical protein GUITHDRAFT_103321 [Guillardia theta CCMP2712]|uniref:Uncharacterized protein n=1 Tax=Guillardia theta (strain CCMP2712) TaxID=905079 RepID=L1JR18_GUITC|nr:hypothetical protein GUITHDRAFT_103321 [Guillardia theta CCMP2712]EKX50729.1 hypothetical protein GUITHDRAFT_103321 [Guillardia theta CCMP2712]|eukprot:XP_005837709.1 hypothetical protein GUITHDRAFT_103321 [Guillardia theta CCMP2712]
MLSPHAISQFRVISLTESSRAGDARLPMSLTKKIEALKEDEEVLTAELAKKQSHTADTSNTSYSESLDLAKARRWRQRPASAFVPSNAQRCVIDRKPATARGNPRGEEKLKEARADPKEELNKEIAELRRSMYEEQARVKMLKERRDELAAQRGEGEQNASG